MPGQCRDIWLVALFLTVQMPGLSVFAADASKDILDWSAPSKPAYAQTKSPLPQTAKPESDLAKRIERLSNKHIKQDTSIDRVVTPNPEPGSNLSPEQELLIRIIKTDSHNIDLRSVGEQVTVLRRRVTDHADSEVLRRQLAWNLYLVGDIEGACTELKRAIAMKPDDYAAHTLLAKVLDDGGDHSSSAAEFARSVQLAPDVCEIHILNAACMFRRGEVSQAINEYRRAANSKPTAEGLSGLAEALLAVHDPIGAVKAARQAVSVEPSSYLAHVALTKALLMSGDPETALRTARQSILLSPNSADSHVAMGRALFANKDAHGAVDEFKQAVNLDPLNALARNDLGYALYSQGDIFPAISELRIALRLNPSLAEARNNLEVAVFGLSKQKSN